MNTIFVCIKQVPDTETRIQIREGAVDTSSVKWIINPYDEYAIEAALQQKSQAAELKVVVVGLGPKRVADSLRMALAMGCDEALHVVSEDVHDTYASAELVARLLEPKKSQIHCVYTGQMGIDANQSAFPGYLGELLGLPQVTKVVSLQHEGQHLVAERELENGTLATYKVAKPCVVTANKGLNTPRYPSLPGIMKAKKKPFQQVMAEELGEPPKSLMQLTNFRLPGDKKPVQFIEEGSLEEAAATLTRKLMDEAKAL